MGFDVCDLPGCPGSASKFGFTSSGEIVLIFLVDGIEKKYTIPDMAFHTGFDHCFDFSTIELELYTAVMHCIFLGGYRLQSKSLVGFFTRDKEYPTLPEPDGEFLDRLAGMVLAVEKDPAYRRNVFGPHGLSVLNPVEFHVQGGQQ